MLTMDILAPVDASECSMRALAHAIEEAKAHDGTVDVVHFSEFEDENVERLEAMVENVFSETHVGGDTAFVGDIHLGGLRAANRIGRHIINHAERGDNDRIVMGHHGSGYVGNFILGSAAGTVVKKSTVPVTIVP